MKTLLINPPKPRLIANKDFYLPSSLLYLASSLQKSGVEVKILDLNIFRPWQEDPDNPEKVVESSIIDHISDFQPSLIGIGCLFSGHFPLLLHFSKIIKERYDRIPIVIGGIHPSIHPREILTNCPSIDWIVIGEGEKTIVQLADAVKNSNYGSFDQMDGFAYRQDSKVIVNPKTSFISDLDSLPFPAYDIINIEDYYQDTSHWHNPRKLPINTSIPIITSRSCPMRCTFCSMYRVMGRKWRSRSAQNVVDEIEYLYNTYNHRHFSFFDDQLTLKESRIIAICNEIVRRNLYLQLESQNGVAVRTLDKEVMDAMVSAGLVRIAIAIESGSDFIRNEVIGKNLPRKKIYEVVELLKTYPQLYVKAFFVIGMPEDTHETLRETYNMIKEIDVDMPQIANLIPFPGTPVFDQALRDNLLVKDLDQKNMWRFESFFMSGNKRFFIKPYNLDLEELGQWREKIDSLVETLMTGRKELSP